MFIFSLHVIVRDMENFMDISENVRTFFHNEHVHSVTVQPEPSSMAMKFKSCERIGHDHHGSQSCITPCCCEESEKMNEARVRLVLSSSPVL